MRLRLGSAWVVLTCVFAVAAWAAQMPGDVPAVLTDALSNVCLPLMAGTPLSTAASRGGFAAIPGLDGTFRKEVGVFIVTVELEDSLCKLQVVTGRKTHPGSAHDALTAWNSSHAPVLPLLKSREMDMGYRNSFWGGPVTNGRNIVLALSEMPEEGPVTADLAFTTYVYYGYE